MLPPLLRALSFLLIAGCIPLGPGSGLPRSTVLLDNMKLPVSLNFAPDGRLFFNEVLEGHVRVYQDGALLERPWTSLEVARGPEAGLLGLALDPDFERNRYVYLYYTEPDPERRNRVPLRNRVVRMIDRGGTGTDPLVILDDLPASRTGRHNGGRLAFGPDGKLYVTVGNAETARFGQELGRLGGKVLRINPDGSTPDDNPFPGSPVFAYGFRNPFGIAFHPVNGVVYVSDNSGKGHDELNVVRPGGNYGSSVVEGRGDDPRFIDPIWESDETSVGPTGMLVYSGPMFPEFQNDLFFCAVHTGSLQRVKLAPPGFDQIVSMEEIAQECRTDVTVAPDGSFYYSGINRIFRLAR